MDKIDSKYGSLESEIELWKLNTGLIKSPADLSWAE